MAKTSAGLLMFRVKPTGIEYLLAHPGGPMWSKRDAGVWTIPKGEVNPGEDPLDAGCREFAEETGIAPKGPFAPLPGITQRSGKRVIAWAFRGDCDPAIIRSNFCFVEWPPRSGKRIEVPEVDRCEWFPYEVAKTKINPAQVPLLVACQKVAQ